MRERLIGVRHDDLNRVLLPRFEPDPEPVAERDRTGRPGGVICTNRSPSMGTWSWSAWKPIRS